MTSLDDTVDHWPELGKALEWLWEQQQKAVVEVERTWRLYYKGTRPEQAYHGPPWPNLDMGFIEITANMARQVCASTHRVVDGQIEEIDRYRLGMLKLVESEQGEYGTSEYMSLLLEPEDEYEPVKRYSRHS